ncbi:hypothetical protein [Achromobacter deleyi]|uniref:hypothetical protein n=1 Tax=Achromobacter deleyi TaxID=1353891 RepID=UPI001E2F7E22|nr:hypothetical protein [Achromobacter deleyi]
MAPGGEAQPGVAQEQPRQRAFGERQARRPGRQPVAIGRLAQQVLVTGAAAALTRLAAA